MKNLIIRRGKKEDVEKLWKLEAESRLYHKNFRFNNLDKVNINEKIRNKWIKNFVQLSKKRDFVFFVAEINNEIVGVIGGDIFKWLWADSLIDMASVQDLIILKKYRRQGIATLLMKEFEKWVRFKKVNFSSLNVRFQNKSAQELYKHFGYTGYNLAMLKKIK